MKVPHNLDAEMSVLSSIFIDNEELGHIAETLPPEAFYGEKHRVIYRQMLALYEAGEPIDIVTLTDALRTAGQLESVGGLAYLVGIQGHSPVSAYAPSYARIVREAFRGRELINLFKRDLQAVYDGKPVDEVLVEHEATLTTFSRFDVLERGPQDYYEGALDLIEGQGGLSTGLADLDDASGGLVKGGYNVIAGRPSMGKSALLRGILNHRAEQGDRVALFSIDQSGDEIYALEAARRAGTGVSAFRPDKSGRRLASDRQVEDARRHLEYLRDEWSQNFIVHDSRAELSSLLHKARQEIRDGATIIAVDHIQSVMLDGRTDEANVVSSISRSFKALSREYNVTVVMLSQLGRSVESRNPPKPMLSDLRQSGAIEEDANQVMFIYRDDYYAHLQKRESSKPGVAEIIIAKNKLSEPQTVELSWKGHRAEFGLLAKRHQQQMGGY